MMVSDDESGVKNRIGETAGRCVGHFLFFFFFFFGMLCIVLFVFFSQILGLSHSFMLLLNSSLSLITRIHASFIIAITMKIWPLLPQLSIALF